MNQYSSLTSSHQRCMMCSNEEHNPFSAQLQFTPVNATCVTTTFCVEARFEGYNGLMHGGMTSSLLDAAMTHCLFHQGIKALTAELTVRFIAPIRLGSELTIEATLVGSRRGIHQLEAHIMEGGQKLARASAKFITPPEYKNA